ncbi:hypothetical protein ACHAWF_007821 [Thalassiosira exigua]
MMTMNAVPPKSGNYSDSESDDSDVAFVYMDFSGVDFGGDDLAKEADAKAPFSELTSNDDSVFEQPTECEGNQGKEVINIGRTNRTSENGRAPSSEADHDHPSVSSDCLQARPNLGGNFAKKSVLPTIIFSDAEIDLSNVDQEVLAMEKDQLLPGIDNSEASSVSPVEEVCDANEVNDLFALLNRGKYVEVLQSPVARMMFGSGTPTKDTTIQELSMTERIKWNMLNYCSEGVKSKSIIVKCIESQIIGTASLNLFLQLNYTGPSMDRGLKPEEGTITQHPLDGINPHDMFQSLASAENDIKPLTLDTASLPSISEDGAPSEAKGHDPSQKVRSLKDTNTTDAFHNAVLSELATDGEWPFPVCVAPYFLLLSRAILSTLAEPKCPFRLWHNADPTEGEDLEADAKSSGIRFDNGAIFAGSAKHLFGAKLWSARAIVAHRRLISTRRDDDDGLACPTLWNELEAMFSCCLSTFCDNPKVFDDEGKNRHLASVVMLEWGLAQHHFRKVGRGKASFNKALEMSSLEVEVTGAEGKRTKYQTKSTAQYLVRAKPSAQNETDRGEQDSSSQSKNTCIEKQMIKHDDVSDDALLLEKINYDVASDNVHYELSILDQSILLALCLDVKNDNPMDGLTGEQMGGFLARVLNQHDDWMVYATALLERAWLECERTHGRERAILQIQALADQHSNRLTLTQSTFKSVEEDSAPAQERLRNLHGIVYPPRWDMLRDLAERYAKLGVVTSAAEIFEELELWDEVVECYRIAGKESKAEEVVRARLKRRETPRMWAALGDLTRDPKYFEQSLELSNGKFYDAHVALGKYYFDNGDLDRSLKYFLKGLEIKPLMPAVWFRVGTIGMQLKLWDTALRAFTEVVQQEPEEGDAWANVASIHMHRNNPSEAYPALIEVSNITQLCPNICELNEMC